ncbi:DUF4149 domain-containing protein [Caenimonas aquaedulcis]|uniref:DUF4149 domain-containing protein n=1 Tax=Caenimonas aquaedulcis TaxID=2793270 RepID=A0A931H1C3_9BURK|nr:DUF4149 domain-containing protein [Caenimonas aquaedulcis]MBG9386730.1 DUF4149 domain-containing protein [Caenimonas aquaedulcis]
MRARVPVFAAALWWGSLTAVGFLVVPLLFNVLPTPAMAGQTAARLFSGQTWLSIACGVLVMMASRPRDGEARMGWAGGVLVYVFAGVLLALLVEFAVAPRIVARENLALWHGLGSAMYLAQWLCAGVALWKLTSLRSSGPS